MSKRGGIDAFHIVQVKAKSIRCKTVEYYITDLINLIRNSGANVCKIRQDRSFKVVLSYVTLLIYVKDKKRMSISIIDAIQWSKRFL